MNARAAEDISTTSIVGHFINGSDVADNGRTQAVTNPATGEITKQVALASRSTVEDAISAAEAAFPAWRNTPPAKRAKVTCLVTEPRVHAVSRSTRKRFGMRS